MDERFDEGGNLQDCSDCRPRPNGRKGAQGNVETVERDGRPTIMFMAADPRASAQRRIDEMEAEKIANLVSKAEVKFRNRCRSLLAVSSKPMRKSVEDDVCKAQRQWLISAFQRGAEVAISHALRSGEETRKLDDALGSKARDFAVEKFFCVGKGDFQARLANSDLLVLHLSCHGSSRSGRVAMVWGHGERLAQSEFCQLAKNIRVRATLVVLAACHSATIAKQLVDEGVANWAIGASGEVEDEKLVAFIGNFYASLMKTECFVKNRFLPPGDEVRELYNRAVSASDLKKSEVCLYPLVGKGDGLNKIGRSEDNVESDSPSREGGHMLVVAPDDGNEANLW